MIIKIQLKYLKGKNIHNNQHTTEAEAYIVLHIFSISQHGPIEAEQRFCAQKKKWQ